MSQLLCGAGRAKITMDPSLLPVILSPKRRITGIADDSYVRVIAIKNEQELFLLVAFDLGHAPQPPKWIPELCEKYKIPEKNILYAGTHAHASVVTHRPYDHSTPDGMKLDAIINGYRDRLMNAAEIAVSSLRPARFGIATGKSYLNVNRNQIYRVRDEGNNIINEYCALGRRFDGPSDKSLVHIRFEDMNGKPIAFFTNYALHNVAMHANKCGPDGGMALSSDIAGLACQYMEDHFPGSVAIWTSGAAGDQNPIMMNVQYQADPVTGNQRSQTPEHGDYTLCVTQATILYNDILLLNDTLKCTNNEASMKAEFGYSQTPARVIPKNYAHKEVDPDFDALNIEIDQNSTYDIRLHLMELGDIAIVGISGELYSSIGQTLKLISPAKDTIIVNLDEGADGLKSGYIYDDEGCVMGGNGGLARGESRIVPGYVPGELSAVLLSLFRETGRLQ